MKSKPFVLATVFGAIATVAILGCVKAPGLTGDQVDQFLEIQKTVAAEQTAVGHARDDLEADREHWAERERSDPIIASAIESATLLIVCCLPVVVIALLLWQRPQQPDYAVVEKLLLELHDLSSQERSPSNPTVTPMLEDHRKRRK